MTTYFSQTMIIFTSNLGASEMWDLAPGDPDGPGYEQLRAHFTEKVEEKFRAISRPELFGRLKPGIVVFDMLRTGHVAGITDGMVNQLVESAREQRGLDLRVDRAAVRAWMVECMRDPEVAKYGGREIRNRLDRLRTGLVAYIVAESPAPGSAVDMTVRPDGSVVVEAVPSGAPDDPGPAGGRDGVGSAEDGPPWRPRHGGYGGHDGAAMAGEGVL
jgi:ATP-dependent Clp protease ATP-binding subunit ClpA